VKYLSWDFETQPVSELPTALERLGHTKTEPTLTIWEGVTMYLTESAIDATVRAVRSMDAPGSLLAFTYFERARLIDNQSPTLGERVVRAAVKSFGEPFTFGWDPGELGPWLAEHGYQLRSDATEVELAHELLPEDQAEKVRSSGRHVAVARAI
jgi:methyltransferase (TIGR00027 family)